MTTRRRRTGPGEFVLDFVAGVVEVAVYAGLVVYETVARVVDQLRGRPTTRSRT